MSWLNSDIIWDTHRIWLHTLKNYSHWFFFFFHITLYETHKSMHWFKLKRKLTFIGKKWSFNYSIRMSYWRQIECYDNRSKRSSIVARCCISGRNGSFRQVSLYFIWLWKYFLKLKCYMEVIFLILSKG